MDDTIWTGIQQEFSLRDKDRDRVTEAVEAVKAYVAPQDGTTAKSDYEIVSVLCYDKRWRMNVDQWKNFIAAVRKAVQAGA